jgi:hypothetical protein
MFLRRSAPGAGGGNEFGVSSKRKHRRQGSLSSKQQGRRRAMPITRSVLWVVGENLSGVVGASSSGAVGGLWNQVGTIEGCLGPSKYVGGMAQRSSWSRWGRENNVRKAAPKPKRWLNELLSQISFASVRLVPRCRHTSPSRGQRTVPWQTRRGPRLCP